MKLRKRLFNLIMLVVAGLSFAAVTLVAIILAQGRILNDEGQITQTSIIRINSVPKDVGAYLNGTWVSLVDNKIEWVNPGTYTLRLEKQGYKSWEKTLKILPGIVEDVYAQLYPEELELVRLTNTNINQVKFSKDGAYVFYTVLNTSSPEEKGLWRLKLIRSLFDFTEPVPQRLSNLSTIGSTIATTEDYELIPSKDSSKIILQSRSNKILEVFDTNQLSSINLFSELGFIPDKLSWFRNSESLIIEKDGLVFEYEINSKQKTVILFDLNKAYNYSVGSDFVYLYSSQTATVLQKYKNKTVQNILISSLPVNLTNEEIKYISASENENIFVIGLSESIYYFDLSKSYYKLLENVSDIVEFDEEGLVLLLRNGNNYSSLTLEETSAGNSYISTLHTLGVIDLGVEDFIELTPNNKSIVRNIKTVSGEFAITFSDVDGNNLNTLFTDERISRAEISVTTNSENLYVTLIENQQTGHQQNIFKINLLNIN
jgi:hypothetical protein